MVADWGLGARLMQTSTFLEHEVSRGLPRYPFHGAWVTTGAQIFLGGSLETSVNDYISARERVRSNRAPFGGWARDCVT